MTCAEMTAVVVTKGDRDISEVLLNLQEFGQTIIWDNAEDPLNDLKVYGRYEAVAAPGPEYGVVALVDDDVLVDWPHLAFLYQPGKIVCNMPEEFRHGPYSPSGISLVGFGCIADRAFFDDPFRRYDDAGLPRDEVFLRECDRVFTWLNRDRVVWVDVPITRLPCSYAEDRMWRQPRHGDDFKEIQRRLALIK